MRLRVPGVGPLVEVPFRVPWVNVAPRIGAIHVGSDGISHGRTSEAQWRLTGCAQMLQPIEKRKLAGKNLVARDRNWEPGGAVDFGKSSGTPAVRRPFQFEFVA